MNRLEFDQAVHRPCLSKSPKREYQAFNAI